MTITYSINEDLTFLVTKWNYAIHTEKALGPYGMTSLLYQKLWDIVTGYLTCMVNEFLFDGVMAQELNGANLCFIPKKISLLRWHNFV